jgi:anti-anti-sigma regulatory factor
MIKILFSKELTINNITNIKNKLLNKIKKLNKEEKIFLDLRPVEFIDTIGIQFLISLEKYLQLNSSSYEIIFSEDINKKLQFFKVEIK